MASPIAFRYTLIDAETDASVLRWINAKSPGHLVIKHDSDEDVNRPHWHALLWSDKKIPALRADFRKVCPDVNGPGAYSMTEIKKKTDEDPVEAYERYMCHGKELGDPVNVVSAFGAKYTEEWFKEQNNAYYAKRKEFKKKEKKASETRNLVNDLYKECEEAAIHEKMDIARKLVKMYVRESRPLNSFYAKSVVKTVWAKLNGRQAEEDLALELANF